MNSACDVGASAHEADVQPRLRDLKSEICGEGQMAISAAIHHEEK